MRGLPPNDNHLLTIRFQIAERQPTSTRRQEWREYRRLRRGADAWLAPNRRSSKDYERLVQTSENSIGVTMIRLILKRLARGAYALPNMH